MILLSGQPYQGRSIADERQTMVQVDVFRVECPELTYGMAERRGRRAHIVPEADLDVRCFSHSRRKQRRQSIERQMLNYKAASVERQILRVLKYARAS